MKALIAKRFSQIVENLIHQKKLTTQEKLAEEYGISKQVMGRYWTGKDAPPDRLILFFHDNYNMNINYLYSQRHSMFNEIKVDSLMELNEPKIGYQSAKDELIKSLRKTVEVQEELINQYKKFEAKAKVG